MADRINLDEFDWSDTASPDSPPVQPNEATDPAVAPAAPSPDPLVETRRSRPSLGLDESLLPEYARELGKKNIYKQQQRSAAKRINLDEFDWAGDGPIEPGTGGAYKDDDDWAPWQGIKAGFNTGENAIFAVGDMARIMMLPKEQQAAAMVELGKKGTDPTQASMTFGGIEEIGSKNGYLTDAITFVLENAGQMVGSAAAAATYGGLPGAGVGGVAGSVLPGPGTAAGALTGFGAGSVAGYGAMGIGGMYMDLLGDKAVQDGLANGSIDPTSINTLATTAGAAIGALDVLPASKIFKQVVGKSGGAKFYKETIKKAVLAGAKSGAINEGGTEAIQGAISEVAQAWEGGDVNALERAMSVLNQGIAGAIGGAGPGAYGEHRENQGRVTDVGAGPLPGVIGPTQPLPAGPPPTAGTSGANAQPGGFAPGVGPGTTGPGGLGTQAQPPLGGGTTGATRPDYSKTGTKATGRGGKVTTVAPGAIPEDVGEALTDDEDIGLGEFAPEGVAPSPVAAAGRKVPPPSRKPAAATKDVASDLQAALGDSIGPGTQIDTGIPPAPNVDVTEGLPDYGAPRQAPAELPPEPVIEPEPEPLAPEPAAAPEPVAAPAALPATEPAYPSIGAEAVEEAVELPEAGVVEEPPNLGPMSAEQPSAVVDWGDEEGPAEPAPTHADVIEGLPDYGGPEYEDTEEEAAARRAERSEDFAGSINRDFQSLDQARYALGKWREANPKFEPDEQPRHTAVRKGAKSTAEIKTIKGRIKAGHHKHRGLKREYEELRGKHARALGYTYTALDEVKRRVAKLDKDDAIAFLKQLSRKVHAALEEDTTKPHGRATRPVRARPAAPRPKPGSKGEPAPRGTPVALKPKSAPKKVSFKKPVQKWVPQRVTALTADADKLAAGKAVVSNPDGTKLGTVTKVITHAPARKFKQPKGRAITLPGEEYPQKRVQLSFQKEPVTLDELFSKYHVTMSRLTGTLVPQVADASDRAVAAMAEHFADPTAEPVILKGLLAADQITALEADGLAEDGTMSRAEFRRWRAREKGLVVENEPEDVRRRTAFKEDREATRPRVKRSFKIIDRIEPGRTPSVLENLSEDRMPSELDRAAAGESIDAHWERMWDTHWRKMPLRSALRDALELKVYTGNFRPVAEGEELQQRHDIRESVDHAIEIVERAKKSGLKQIHGNPKNQFERAVAEALWQFTQKYNEHEKGRTAAERKAQANIRKSAKWNPPEVKLERVTAGKEVSDAAQIRALTETPEGWLKLRRSVYGNVKLPPEEQNKFFSEMERHFDVRTANIKKQGTFPRRLVASAEKAIRRINERRAKAADAVAERLKKAAARRAEKLAAATLESKRLLKELIDRGELTQAAADELLDDEATEKQFVKRAERTEKIGPVLAGAIMRTKLPVKAMPDPAAEFTNVDKKGNPVPTPLKAKIAGAEAARQEKTAGLKPRREAGEHLRYTRERSAFRQYLEDRDAPTEAQIKRAEKMSEEAGEEISVRSIQLMEMDPRYYRQVSEWVAGFVTDVEERLTKLKAALPTKVHSVYNTPLENGILYIKKALATKITRENVGTSRRGSKTAAPNTVPDVTEELLGTPVGEELVAGTAKTDLGPETSYSGKKPIIYDAAAMIEFLKGYIAAGRRNDLLRQRLYKESMDGLIFEADKQMSNMSGREELTAEQVDQQREQLEDALLEAADDTYEDTDEGEGVAATKDEGTHKDFSRTLIEHKAEQLAKKWGVKISKSRVLESPRTVGDERTAGQQHRTTVRDAVARLLKGAKKNWVQKAIVRSVARLIGDMPVHFVGHDVLGNKAGRFLDGRIELHENLLGRPAMLADVLIHEMVHGATAYALRANLHGTRDVIEAMMRELKSQIGSTTSPIIGNAFKNADEFLASAMEQGEFQELLKLHRPSVMTRARVRALGKGREAPSYWDIFVAAVSKTVATFAPGKAGHEYIDSLLSVYGKAAISSSEQQALRDTDEIDDSDIYEHPFDIAAIQKAVASAARHTFHHNVLVPTESLRRIAAQQFFGGNFNNPVSRLIDMLLQHVRLVDDKMTGANEALSELRDWWQVDPTTRKPLVAKAHALAHQSSIYHVDLRKSRAQQPHIWDDANHPLKDGAVRTGSTFRHEQHAGMREAADRLHAEWMALPEELRDVMSKNIDILNDMMVEYELQLITNAVEVMTQKTNGPVTLPGTMTPAEAAKEIYERKVSPALEKALGANAKTFSEYGRLGLRGGLYVPSYRTGKYFISGRFKVPTPKGAIIDQKAYDERGVLRFVFNTRPAASAYVREMGRTDEQQVINYSTVYVDPKNKNHISPKKTAAHTHELFYVTVQNSFMAMSDSKRSLQKQVEELRAGGEMEHVSDPVQLKEHGQLSSSMPLQLSRMLHNVDQMAGIGDKQKKMLKDGMAHVFVQSQMGNRITKRLQKRKGVFGAETGADEMISSFRTTAEMMARHTVALTRIEEIRDATKEINDVVNALRNASTTNHSSITKLSPELQALVGRNYAKDSDAGDKLEEILTVINSRLEKNMTAKGWSAGMETGFNSVMSAVTMTYLVGPSYLALNTASLMMFTYPRMASKMAETHGYFRGWTMAAQYLWSNAQEISWLRNMATGVTEAMAEGLHFIKGFGPRANWLGEGRSLRRGVDRVGAVKDRLRAGKVKYAEGKVDVLETARLDSFIGQAGLDQANTRDIMRDAETTVGKAGMKAARGIEQSTRIFRALTEGIEINNRAVPMLAYYEYFRDTGMSHEQAKAQAINNMTREQVGYSKENWSPWMAKGPLGAAMLFKKFPIQQAQNYWESIANTVGEDPVLRKTALREIANTTLMLAMIGGFSGLPIWEPFKYLYALLAKIMGWGNYDELKTEGEKLMDKWIGGMPAEMVMYGATRAIGVDVANRVALDTILMMSLPKEDTPESFAGIIGGIVAGAPGSAAYKAYEFVKEIDSDKGYAKWLSNAPAPKFVKDIFKAYDLYENGPTTTTGVKAGKPVGLPAAILQATGFKPSSQSRPFEVGSVAKRRTETRIKEQRKSLLQRMVNQGLTGDNNRRLREWNRSHPGKDESITMRDFAYSRRRRHETEAEIRAANR